jgi:hypothetical protein
MNLLPNTKYKNNERTVSGNVPVENSDVLINVDTSLVPCTIYLKEIPKDYWSTLYKLYVKDITGNAATNTITIIAPTGYSINNQQQIVINVNGGGAVIRIQDNIDYNASLNYCCSKGVEFIDLLNSQLLSLIANNLIVAGNYYNVTDAIYADLGVVLLGINPNEVSLQGEGKYLNADYQKVGNYSTVTGFNSAVGLWSLNPTIVVAGDCVVWNNFNYVNLTGNWGTAPSTDLINWQVLPKLVTNGYILEIDFVKYNKTLNVVFYRSDERGNEVELFAKSKNTLLDFQWGRNRCTFNKISGTSELYFTNSNAEIRYNTMSGGTLKDTTIQSPRVGSIISNTIINGTISLNSTFGNVSNNIVTSQGSLSCNSLNAVGLGVSIGNNIINTSGSLIFDYANSGNISLNEIVRGATLRIDSLSGGNVIENYCSDGGLLQVADVPNLIGLYSCEVSDNNVVNLPILINDIYYSKIRKGYSNWVAYLDFNDIIIWNGTDLTINSVYNYIGYFYIQNANPLTPIIKIINMPTNHNCNFSPIDLQQCAFQHTLVGVSTANDLLCDAPSSTNIITGRTDGTDFIEYRASGTKNIRTNLVLLA